MGNTLSNARGPRPLSADKVFAIPELLEMILVHLPIRDLLLVQRTNKQVRNTIQGSILLQRKLFHTLLTTDVQPHALDADHLERYFNTLLLGKGEEQPPEEPPYPIQAWIAICPTIRNTKKRFYRTWQFSIEFYSRGSATALPHAHVKLYAHWPKTRVRWYSPEWPKLDYQGSHRQMLLVNMPMHVRVSIMTWEWGPEYDNSDWSAEELTFGKLLDRAQEFERRIEAQEEQRHRRLRDGR